LKKFGFLIILCIFSISLFSQGSGGYCLYYNGTDDYLELPDITQLNNASAFTISFWIKQDNSIILERFFYKINGTTGAIDEDISIASYNGSFYFEVGNGANSYGYCTSTISTGTWFHVAAVYDGTLAGNSNRMKLYIDGSSITLTYSGTIPATTFIFSGISEYVSYPYENSGMGSEYFGGYLDELRIWSYARTGTQINDDMYTPLSGSETGLVAYWKFDENGGQIAYDETSNNYHGTLGSTTGVDVNDPGWFESDAPLPVTLSSFTAIYENSTPILHWTTQSESSNLGWNVYRSFSQNMGQASQINNELIPGAGTTSEPTDYQFTDEYDVIVGQTYWYWLESISGAGETEIYGPVSLTITSEGNDIPDIPIVTELHQNFPNPFNPSTLISFDIKENETGVLSIYNIKGQLIVTDEFEVGRHHYAWDARDHSSGIYLYKLQTESYTKIMKMLLVK
jgi:hypothetical protein